MNNTRLSAYQQAVSVDNSIPIDQEAVDLWLRDVNYQTRWLIRPLLQSFFVVVLHITWLLKRLPLPQFSSHKTLQWLICWFCKWFVSPETNQLIIRHYATESNLLNFLYENTGPHDFESVDLYPRNIGEMMKYSFVDHDQELFRMMRDIGKWERSKWPANREDLKWTLWRDIELDESVKVKRWTQVLDFETSHALFMCIFCLLLTSEEYRDAINGFNLDQSIAIRIGNIIDDASVHELAYNKYPLYFVGPWNLGQRFLMHGFFTEYMHARLLDIKHTK
jgi:hypothetical protein